MPWCDQCNKFWNPPSLTSEGACPACGQVVVDPAASSSKVENDVKVPWHFKLLLLALTVYLVFRAWQGVAWVSHHL